MSTTDTEHQRWVASELLRDKIERRLDDIEASEAGKRCISCAHVKHNDLGYCQVGQCSCAVGTSLAGTARAVSRDLADLLNRQASEVARLDAVVTAVREVHRYRYLPGDAYPTCDGCGYIADDEDDPCPTRRALDGGAV